MSPVLTASLLAGALASDNRSSLRLMVSQPICGGLLTGWALGNVHDGFLAGALVQMLFLGMLSVRGMRVPDLALGGVAASALYVLSQGATRTEPGARGLALALALAASIGVALLGSAAGHFWESRSFFLARAAQRAVDGGRLWPGSVLHFSSLIVHFVFGGVIVGLAVLAGAPIIRAAAGAAPARWSEALGSLPVLLPFVGVGFLLLLHLTRVRIFLFGAGFAIVLLVTLFKGW